MLDPLTALSLASAIIQFVDFGIGLITDGVEIYKKGFLPDNDELEHATRDLTQLSKGLASPQQLTFVQVSTEPAPLSRSERDIQELARSCKKLGDQLLDILDEVKAQKPGNWLDSFRKTIQNSKNKDKTQDLETRLKRLRDQLAFHLLAALRDQNSSIISKLEMISVDENNISNKIDDFKRDIIRALEKQSTSVEKGKLFNNVGTMCLGLVEESDRVERTQLILRSLRFKTIRLRQTSIKHAHPRTYDWIFSDFASSTRPRSPYSQWMKSDNGIFWIAGKPGSGKSTLMKFLCDRQNTRNALQEWAGSCRLIIASYFFWSSGTAMQKSQEGLLQTLLYQILRQCPEIVPTACPAQWRETVSPSGLEPWTIEDLSEVFKNVANQGQLNRRFCFFVDGLDEYDGEHTELIDLLAKCANSPSIKLCVSSRPWNVFVQAFGDDPTRKLLLQDFTTSDIRLYVNDQFEEDVRFVKLIKEDAGYHLLVEELVDRAQGVFLWVFLVIRSLLRGLIDGNDIDTMQLRLRELPPDLEEYFKRIFETVESVYREQTGQIFQMIVTALSPLSPLTFHFLDKERIDSNYSLTAPTKPLLDSEVDEISERMIKHLNARCKDLVEINTDPGEPFRHLRYKVEFLHRTVRDFLLTSSMHSMLESMKPKGFDARISLCRALLAQLKCLPASNTRAMTLVIDAYIKDIMSYAQDIEIKDGRAEVEVLDELDRFQSAFKKPKLLALLPNSKDRKASESFMTTATKSGLHIYVEHKVAGKPYFLRKPKELPLLSVALQASRSHETSDDEIEEMPSAGFSVDLNMILILLKGGADPNVKLFQRTAGIDSHFTIWETFLRHCLANRDDYSESHPEQLFQTAKMLIEHGADPDLRCETDAIKKTVQRRIKGGRRSTTAIERQYSSPSKILAQVLKPAEHEQIVQMLAESRAIIANKKRSSRPAILKWFR